VTLVNRAHFDLRVPAGSLAELTAVLRSDPERYRGRIACYDIERNGLGFLALLHESLRGAAFNAFMQVLAASAPRVFGSNPALVEEVASGRAAVGYHVLGSYALRAVRDYPSLAIAASHVPALAVSRLALISKHAPHPNAARHFLDYLLSEDGQRHLEEAGLFPVRRRPDSGVVREPGAVAPIRLDSNFDALLDQRRRHKLLRQWQDAVAAPAAALAAPMTGELP
jgi:iron(III) transport system substrate-binding protein